MKNTKQKTEGQESIVALLEKHTTKRGLLTDQVFPELRKEVLERIREEENKILSQTKRISSEVLMPSEYQKIREAMRSIVANFLCLELDERYDRISNELFNLKRTVYPNKLETDSNTIGPRPVASVEIPLFVSVPYNSNEPWKFFATLEPKSDDAYRARYKINLSAPIPPLTLEIKRKAREAKATFEEAWTRALRTQTLGDLLMSDPDNFNKGRGLDLKVLWIPEDSEIDIKVEEQRRDPDPILIGVTYGRNYLIGRWNVKGEKPFEHYLAEFKE